MFVSFPASGASVKAEISLILRQLIAQRRYERDIVQAALVESKRGPGLIYTLNLSLFRILFLASQCLRWCLPELPITIPTSPNKSTNERLDGILMPAFAMLAVSKVRVYNSNQQEPPSRPVYVQFTYCIDRRVL